LRCIDFELEVARFYDWLETNPNLGAAAIVLWFALLDTWRKAGYQNEITVAMSTLEVKTRFKSTALKTARNDLAQFGRIEWKKRSGNQSALYKIIPLSPLQSLNDHNPAHKCDHNHDRSSDHKCDPLYNNNNLLKHDDNVVVVNNRSPDDRNALLQSLNDHNPAHKCDHSGENPAKQAMDYINQKTASLLSTTGFLEIQDFLQQGVEVALICRAIDASMDSGARNWVYAKRIIDNCIIKGILTLEAYEANEANRNAQIARKQGGGRYGANRSGNNAAHAEGQGNASTEGERLNQLAREKGYTDIGDTKVDY